MSNTLRFGFMSTSLVGIASGPFGDGEAVGRGTVCANVRTYGSVGAVGW